MLAQGANITITTNGNTLTIASSGGAGGVTSLTGGGGVTVSAASGPVTLGSTATSANTPNAIVSRDGGGNFSAGSVTLAGSLNLPDVSSGPDLMFSGANSFMYADNNQNLFMGVRAGYEGTSGFGNTAVGASALSENASGNYNTAIGVFALLQNTSGFDNTADGVDALYSNTTGSANTANGVNALYSNTSGSNNTANGVNALLRNTTGFANTANGVSALIGNTTGFNNTANGVSALSSNTNGSGNTAVGYLALLSATSGQANIALGAGAGFNITTGNNNIEIGNSGDATDNGVIRIGFQGSQTGTFIAGISGATISGGAAVYVNASTGQLGVQSSSARFKQDIQPMDRSSDVLYALKPVTFRYKRALDPEGIPQFGLVAEQVEQVDPDLVVHDRQHGIYTVRYEAVNAMLLNEFLKQHQTVEKQHAQIQHLQEQNASLEARLEALERVILKTNGGVK
jgi:hypothetical protein